jgi:hypothetical protein
MNARISIGVVGFFVLAGALVTMWTPVDLGTVRAGNTDKLMTCGDVFSDHLTTAPHADRDNEMVGIVSGNHSEDTNYVAECRSARELRQTWTIPLAIVGGGLQVGAIASSVVVAYRKSLPS